MFGCFRIEEIRDQDNETGLKEGGGIEMSIYSAFHIRDDALALFRLKYLPITFLCRVLDPAKVRSRTSPVSQQSGRKPEIVNFSLRPHANTLPMPGNGTNNIQ